MKRNTKRNQKGGSCGDYNDPALEYRHCGGKYDSPYEIPSDVAYTYLSEKTSELTSHWANPAYPARGGGSRKQKGGSREYPFIAEQNDYPIPNKTSFTIDDRVSSNFVSNKDLFGFEQKGGRRTMKQKGGGGCGCGSAPITLGGGSKKKQRGSGFGYNLDVSNAITNRPDVVRYSTEGTGYSQKAGSMASNSLMNYFLDFQSRCNNTEIY